MQGNIQEKYKVLTCIPTRFTIREITTYTGCSDRLARQSREMVETNGAFSFPNPRQGRRLAEEIVAKIKAFYQDTDNTRESPRANDVYVVNEDGVKSTAAVDRQP